MESEQYVVLSIYLDGVAVLQSIELERTCIVRSGELRPDIILGETMVHAQVLNP